MMEKSTGCIIEWTSCQYRKMAPSKALENTYYHRKDLLNEYPLTKEDKDFLDSLLPKE